MFGDIKKQIQANFDKLARETVLFYVTIDREKIWEEYLNGFPPDNKQEHTCNCCRSFLRQFGGVVAIIQGKRVSVWDNVDGKEYQQSVDNLTKYIHSLPITDIFLSDVKKCGTNKNLDGKRNVIWEHFYFEIKDLQHICKKDQIDTKKAEKRADHDVLERSLKELTLDSLDTVLELIGQNSLYRGKEFEGNVEKFRDLKKKYDKSPEKENFVWSYIDVHQSITKIRNTAIGTLLVDLSEGTDLDIAVTKFEKVVAPTNYKRPTSLVTPKMIQEAKDKLTEMGLLESIERRYANVADLDTNNLLFVDKSSELTDVFQEISKEVLVSPKSLTKVEEVTIDDFLTKIVPTAKSVEVLLENRHLSNLVTLVTAQDKNAKSLFKWGNPFSWSYTGAIADSMKERVKAAGGKVDGVLRFSIQWNEDGKSIIDLDAHAHEPKGQHIYFSTYKGQNNRTPMSGNLDVDMINPHNVGIENITWSNLAKMGEGSYKLRVHNFSHHRNFDGVRTEVEFDGQIYEFSYNKPFTDYIDIAEVTYSKAKGFTIKSLLEGKQTIQSKEQWSVKTNQFTRVKNIMLSPNHWEKTSGNKHYMLILENCVCDETPRPFFNEFLKEEFNENRKVFEILGGKVKILDTKQQLSGVGFSETQRNSLIVRVEGTFKRNLKINF